MCYELIIEMLDLQKEVQKYEEKIRRLRSENPSKESTIKWKEVALYRTKKRIKEIERQLCSR